VLKKGSKTRTAGDSLEEKRRRGDMKETVAVREKYSKREKRRTA